MTIRYDCIECGASLNIKNSLAGTDGQCPKCEAKFTVPESASEEVSTEPAPPKIVYDCVQCGASLKIKASLAGTEGHCPKCKANFVVPNPGEETKAVSSHETEDREPEEETLSLKGDDFDEEQAVADLMMQANTESDDSPSEEELKPWLQNEEEEEPLIQRRGNDDEPADLPAGTAAAESDSSKSADMARFLMTGGEAPSEDMAVKAAEKKGRDWGMTTEDEGVDVAGAARFFAGKSLYIVGGIAGILIAYWIGNMFLGGKSDAPPLGRVRGVVTLDGKPLQGARVTFEPIIINQEDTNLSSSSSLLTDESGNYTLIYSKDHMGAVIGEHVVRVSAENKDGLEIVPAAYNTNSKMIREVESGRNTIDLELLSKPPAE